MSIAVRFVIEREKAFCRVEWKRFKIFQVKSSIIGLGKIRGKCKINCHKIIFIVDFRIIQKNVKRISKTDFSSFLCRQHRRPFFSTRRQHCIC